MIDFATSFRRWGRLGIGLLALALVVTGCDAFIDQDLDDSNPQTPSVTEIVTEVPALSRLEEGLQKSNLVEDLEGNGPFTVIAPDDDAFAPIGDGELSQSRLLKTVLEGHVIAGEKVVFENIDSPQDVQTLSGEEITLGSNGSIDGTGLSVTNRDVNASDGVVHVVDGVFADAVNRILITEQYNILGTLVEREGLAGALRDDSLTVFAPSNDALLAAFDDDNSGAVEDDEPQGTDVSDVLQGHVHGGIFSAADFLDDDSDAFPKDTTLTTLSERDISITTNEDGDAVFVNPDDENAAVTVSDVKTRNGRIHGIDAVLLP
jgi:uncharacterized surface protein with fasciclin (FAS1) repeats